MSKYAMIYFPAAIIAAALFYAPFRKKILQPELALAGIIALGLFTPNMLWNSHHDFQTLAHTAANANWGSKLFKTSAFFTFFIQQFAVAGVATVAGLLFLAARPKFLDTGNRGPSAEIVLLVMALTPLIIVAAQAFISRAHANWAAGAYPAAILLVTGFLFRINLGWLTKVSVGFHIFLMLAFTLAVTNFALVDALNLSKATRDIRGWKEQTDKIMAMSKGFDAIAIDDRPLMGAMLYYQRNADMKVVAIDPNARIDNHYEAFMAFDPGLQKRVLFVTTRDDDAHVNYRFKTIIPLGAQTVSIGRSIERTYHLFDISDYHGRPWSAR